MPKLSIRDIELAHKRVFIRVISTCRSRKTAKRSTTTPASWRHCPPSSTPFGTKPRPSSPRTSAVPRQAKSKVFASPRRRSSSELIDRLCPAENVGFSRLRRRNCERDARQLDRDRCCCSRPALSRRRRGQRSGISRALASLADLRRRCVRKRAPGSCVDRRYDPLPQPAVAGLLMEGKYLSREGT